MIRRAVLIALLFATAALPLAYELVVGWVVMPGHLAGGLDSVGWSHLGAALVASLVGTAGTLLFFGFAIWRIASVGRWRFDGAWSLWRVGKWVLALGAVSQLLGAMTPALMSIHLGKVIPAYYDDPAFRDGAPIGYAVPIAVAIGLGMFVVDTIQKSRPGALGATVTS